MLKLSLWYLPIDKARRACQAFCDLDVRKEKAMVTVISYKEDHSVYLKDLVQEELRKAIINKSLKELTIQIKMKRTEYFTLIISIPQKIP